MIKKRVLIFLFIPFIVFLSIVGIGFSFWVFNKDTRQDLKFNVFVTESALAGSFSTPGMPIYAVLDEGMQNVNSTITGVSFYKGGKKTIHDITFNEEHLIDSDLTIIFITNKPMILEEVNELKFGLRVSTTGKLASYLRKTSYYRQMEKQDSAPNDENGEYIDLKAISQTPNYDGTTNYLETMLEDGRWKLTFHFSTIMLASFYTYQEGKCPDTKEKYFALKNDLTSQTDNNRSTFLLELWQGF